MTKKRGILIAIIVFLAAAGLYLALLGNDTKAVREAADRYIKAVRDRNFAVIYEMNADSQKRKLFIERRSYDLKDSSADKNELLKQAYSEQKESFDSTQTAFDLNDIWSEKFVFIPDMNYRILNVAMEQDIENPTAFYVKRINANVEVEVEYAKKETAPVFEGRSIRKADYLIRMIHRRNIARVVKDIAVDDRWLFKGIAVKHGSAVFW